MVERIKELEDAIKKQESKEYFATKLKNVGNMKKEELAKALLQLDEKFIETNDKNRALEVEFLNLKEKATQKEKELLDALEL